MDLDSLKLGKVFLTGHTGFKGTWMTLLLERLGVEVVGYSLEPDANSLYTRLQRTGKITETFGDVRNLPNLKEAIRDAAPSHVVHLAAQALVIDAYQNPTDTFDTNVMGTANLLEACRGNVSIKKIGIVTTDKVYENSGSGRAFTESDSLGADDPYGASKVAAEAAVRAWRTVLLRESAIEVLSLRAGNVIGGGDMAANRLLPDIVRSRFQSVELVVRYPQSTRPWQHALDPLFGYLAALASPRESGFLNSNTFNFGPDSPSLPVSEVVEIAQKYWRNHLDVKFEIDEGRQYEASRLDLNSELSRMAFGWSPVWDQRDAIERTLSWWDSVNIFEIAPLEACENDIDFAIGKWGV